MRFRWERCPYSKAELWNCWKLEDHYHPQAQGRFVGFVRHFQHEGHDQWNAYRVKYVSGNNNPNKYLCTAKTLEEIKAAFEVAVRIE